MHMLDRLKKTVTSVIGNPVCRDYEFTVQTGTCGPGGLWKIYDGRKKSTGQVLYGTAAHPDNVTSRIS